MTRTVPDSVLQIVRKCLPDIFMVHPRSLSSLSCLDSSYWARPITVSAAVTWLISPARLCGSAQVQARPEQPVLYARIQSVWLLRKCFGAACVRRREGYAPATRVSKGSESADW